ncbi:hypothetical protein Nepgr_003009 [Nepenthes gracilis]|uniref:4-coumarate--CoA ligase n=1 Tax=Nepenthes gracilis TaxID=150966 RepID=A0AAD3XD42_NEPGR|nr:hypothetical protein Nepgr_003009 [Nepenthes gracilis]
MARTTSGGTIDPRNGYCSKTMTFHSLRPQPFLPEETMPLSVIDYVFSLHQSTGVAADCPFDSTTFLIDATAGLSFTYAQFIRRVHSLTRSLQIRTPQPLRKGHVAFILSPASHRIPPLYFALLALGVVVSPANPLATESELSHMIKLTKPAIAFATTSDSYKLPPLPLGTIILDSPEFDSLLACPIQNNLRTSKFPSVNQSDSAAILYSSGTTGRIKGVELTHRNFIAFLAGLYHNRVKHETGRRWVSLFTVPLFHVFGFSMVMRVVALAETMVLMERFDFEKMLGAVEKYKIMAMPVSPPIVVALAKSEVVKRYDLSSLATLACGGAPLGKDVAQRFKARFPKVELVQGYGLTETAGGATRTIGAEESERYGSAGRLGELLEARIVDPSSGKSLPPGGRGELWLRGPIIMKGYVRDEAATAATFDQEGWLKTGDICYFDSDGFLYVVDRLKELIKYKAYQVPPAELERLLLSHSEIADAAVVPYPDEEAGQIPMAFVVRKPASSITGAQVMDFIAKQVAPYKKIRRVSFINSIPRNPSGKILRRRLVDQALSDMPAKL